MSLRKQLDAKDVCTSAAQTVGSAADAMVMGDAVAAAFEPLRRDLTKFAAQFDRDGAEDVVQEAFVRLAMAAGRNPARMTQALQTKAYIFAVVRNLCIDHFRRSGGCELGLDDELLGRLRVDAARARRTHHAGPLGEVCAVVSRAREVLAERVADGRTSPERAHGVEQALVAFIVHHMAGLRLTRVGGVYEVHALLTDDVALRALGAETLRIDGVTPETLNQNVFKRRRAELEDILAEAFCGEDDEDAAGALVAA